MERETAFKSNFFHFLEVDWVEQFCNQESDCEMRDCIPVMLTISTDEENITPKQVRYGSLHDKREA